MSSVDYCNPKPIPFWPEVKDFFQHTKMHNQTEDCRITSEAAKKRQLNAVQLEIGECYEVKVSHIACGPAEFSVQLSESLFYLNSMTRKINALALEPLQEAALTGTVYLARQTYPVNQVGRAVLYSLERDFLKAYFIDYGHSETLTYDKIYQLSAQLALDSAYAFKFTLSGSSNWTMSQDLKNYFHDLVLGQTVKIKVCEGSTSSMAQYCQLYLGDQNVKDMITEAFPKACKLAELNQTRDTTETLSESEASTNGNQSDSAAQWTVISETEDWGREAEEANIVQSTDVETETESKDMWVQEDAEEDWNKEVEEADRLKSTSIVAIPPATVEAGTILKGFISCYESEKKFYFKPENTDFNALQDKISSTYKKHDKVLPESEIIPGLFCVAQWSMDSRWYRAEVKSVEISSATVYFVDYGNSETVSFSKIKKIEPDFLELPAQAFQCHIFNAKTLWTVEENQAFKDQIINTNLKVEFVCKMYGTHQVLIREILSKNSKFDFVNDHSTEAETKSSCSESSENLSQNKGWTGPDYFSSDEEDAKATEITKPVRKIPVVKVEPGAILNAKMVFFEEAPIFYTQLGPNNYEFDDLMAEIKTSLQKNHKFLPESAIIPGLPCVAQYHVDKKWYRAVVQSVDNWSATVYFVDYGNTETVSYSMIRDIDPDFLHLPAQAMRCQLFSVEKSWTADECKILEDLLKKSWLELEFICEKNDTYQVLVREIQSGQALSEYINSRFSEGVDVLEAKKAYTELVSTSDLPESDIYSCTENWEPLSVINVQLDVSFNAVPTCYHDPTRFYVQPGPNNFEFDALDKKINSFYEKFDKILPEDKIIPGLFCVAQFSEDLHWYRAEVESVENSSATVCFVDFGNSETVSFSEIKPIEPEFAQLPAQAIPCRLYCPLKSWTEGESDSLYERLCNENLEVKAVGEENGIYHVLMKEILSTGVVPNYINADFIDVADLKHQNLETISSENWEKIFDVEEDWDEIDTPTIPPAATEIDVPFNAVSTYFYEPTRFYVRPGPNNTPFDVLTDNINVTYANYDKILPESKIIPGIFCVAQYSEDLQWYRAKVESVESSSATVCFVDYGNSETVSFSMIKPIETEFAELPAQAIPCKLLSHGKSWTEAESDLLFKRLYFESLVVKPVHEENGIYEVLIKKVLSDGVVSDYINADFVDVADLKQQIIKTIDDTSSGSKGWEETECRVTKNSKRKLVANIPPAAVEVGSILHGSMAYCDDDASLYIQLRSNNEEFKGLTDGINTKYEKNDKVLSESEIIPGLFCVAQYSVDSLWYRALIKSVDSSSATVYFVDYGNTESVNFSKIREIDPDFTQMTAQALKCKLAGTKTSWTVDDIKTLRDLLEKSWLEVEFVSEENGAYQVFVRKILSDVARSELINCRFNEGEKLISSRNSYAASRTSSWESLSGSDYFSGDEEIEGRKFNSRSLKKKVASTNLNEPAVLADPIPWY